MVVHRVVVHRLAVHCTMVCPVGHKQGCVRVLTCLKPGQCDDLAFGWAVALVGEEGRGGEQVERLEYRRQGGLPGD